MDDIIQTIKAVNLNDKEMVLTNKDDLLKAYSFVKDNTNFIVTWKEDSESFSKLIIASHLLAKIENGELILSSIDSEERK